MAGYAGAADRPTGGVDHPPFDPRRRLELDRHLGGRACIGRAAGAKAGLEGGDRQ